MLDPSKGQTNLVNENTVAHRHTQHNSGCDTLQLHSLLQECMFASTVSNPRDLPQYWVLLLQYAYSAKSIHAYILFAKDTAHEELIQLCPFVFQSPLVHTCNMQICCRPRHRQCMQMEAPEVHKLIIRNIGASHALHGIPDQMF